MSRHFRQEDHTDKEAQNEILALESGVTLADCDEQMISNLHPTIREYRVEKTGAKAIITNSKSLINQFCQKLPKDRYWTPKSCFYHPATGLAYLAIAFQTA